MKLACVRGRAGSTWHQRQCRLRGDHDAQRAQVVGLAGPCVGAGASPHLRCPQGLPCRCRASACWLATRITLVRSTMSQPPCSFWPRVLLVTVSIAARFDAQPTAGGTSHWAIRLPGWLRLEHARGQSRSVVAGAVRAFSRKSANTLLGDDEALGWRPPQRLSCDHRKMEMEIASRAI